MVMTNLKEKSIETNQQYCCFSLKLFLGGNKLIIIFLNVHFASERTNYNILNQVHFSQFMVVLM